MRRWCAAWLPLVLAGCNAGPDYRPPPVLSQPGPQALLAAHDAIYQAPGSLPPDWWQLYDDPLLNALELRALAHNTDLGVALASLQQAAAGLAVIRSEQLPQTQLTVEPSYGQDSADEVGAPEALKPGPVYEAMQSFSYDLDLFGRLRRSVQEYRADLQAAQAALDLARVNVAGDTAAAYAQVCSAGLEIAVTQRSIVLAGQALQVTQRRYQAGIEGINDVVRERTLLQQTSANLPTYVAQKRSALFTLATLTGDPPEAFPAAVSLCDTPPKLDHPIPVGDGAALLARRPDVREAERRLAAAVAGVGVSVASLYPSVSIGAGFGTFATAFAHVTEARGFVWNVGPLISWNFPNLTTAEAEVQASNANARGALASFNGTVLTALRETETALSNLAEALDTEEQLAAARDDAAQAYTNTAKLYGGGVGEFLDVLDAQATEINAEASLAQQTAQVAQDQVTLFMALGGGWQDAPPVQAPPLRAVEK